MHPDPRIVVILPVRAEFTNGNLAGFLLSLARQRTALDVVVIINNRESDFAFATPVWEDNQAALSWLSPLAAAGQTSRAGTDKQSAFAAETGMIKDSALSIHLLDLSNGHARNMGLLRQLGIEYAARLTQGMPEKDVILLSADADCRYGPRLVAQIRRTFANASVRMAVLPMLYVPLAPDPAILATHARQHIPLLLDQVLRQYTGAPRARLGAPQLAARLDLLLEAGGYEMLEDGEDFELGQRLIAITRPCILGSPSAIVWTADRAVADGFESGARLAGLRDTPVDTSHAAPPLPLDEMDNPLAVFLAARRTAPGLKAGLERLFGRDTTHWLTTASEHAFWSGIEARHIPRSMADPTRIREALRIVGELERVPRSHAARMLRSLKRYLRLIERNAGCRTQSSGPGTPWPDEATRRLWLEAAAGMLAVPDQVGLR